ncbi:MAG: GNAT family N-acetyltransferase [Gammaproteobacteria bacterium]
MRVDVHQSLDDIPADDWNRVAGTGHPFLRHEFLAALEHNHCVGEEFGWLPQHLGAYDDSGALIGVAPLYLKDNSYGEFVFDWAWADAYQRNHLPYYPKLVAAVPYTPATGPRLLAAAGADQTAVKQALIDAAVDYAQRLGVSSLHWLFPWEGDMAELENRGLMRRTGCQFHWFNHGYRDFDDFLDGFASAKRKKVRRERRRVLEAGLEVEIVHGHEASERQIATAEMFYRTTFDKKWGWPTLNLRFFQEVAETMGEQLVLVLARDRGDYVAGAICFRGQDGFYGRHWGCIAEYHSLHFELCYYQGIDYCIREDIGLFEPGAQGEHKVARGFVPTPTWSAHWIAHPGFRAAIADALRREAAGMRHYMADLAEHLPYRRGEAGQRAKGKG